MATKSLRSLPEQELLKSSSTKLPSRPAMTENTRTKLTCRFQPSSTDLNGG